MNKTNLYDRNNLRMDNFGRLYQRHYCPYLPECVKSFGVDCYSDDFYKINKNTIGLKKHLFENPKWDCEKFKQFLLEKYSNHANGFMYLLDGQVEFENDKFIQLDKCNDAELHNLSVIVEITEDDPYYEEALNAYRGYY